MAKNYSFVNLLTKYLLTSKVKKFLLLTLAKNSIGKVLWIQLSLAWWSVRCTLTLRGIDNPQEFAMVWYQSKEKIACVKPSDISGTNQEYMNVMKKLTVKCDGEGGGE